MLEYYRSDEPLSYGISVFDAFFKFESLILGGIMARIHKLMLLLSMLPQVPDLIKDFHHHIPTISIKSRARVWTSLYLFSMIFVAFSFLFLQYDPFKE